VLQPGTNMIAAGYCMYGSSCTVIMPPRMYFHSHSFSPTFHHRIGCCSDLSQLILSTGNGVNGFTIDPSLGEFILTHPNIKVCDTLVTLLQHNTFCFS
jgi:fructose-1,6-bisphosphatase I